MIMFIDYLSDDPGCTWPNPNKGLDSDQEIYALVTKQDLEYFERQQVLEDYIV